MLEFFVNNTTSQVMGTTSVDDGEWHFITGTFGNQTLRIYVDGIQEGEVGSNGGVDINPNDLPVMIGGESSSGGGQQYVGTVDEVAMFKRKPIISLKERINLMMVNLQQKNSWINLTPKFHKIRKMVVFRLLKRIL